MGKAYRRIAVCGIALTLFFSGSVFSQQADSLTDPMKPPRSIAATVPQTVSKAPSVNLQLWKLTAVLTSEKRSVAVVNGQSLMVGEMFEGFKVMEIRKDRVLLKKGVEKIVLKRAVTGLVKK